MAGNPVPADVAEHWRTYRLVRLTGWDLDTIEDSSALELEWLLACEDAENRASIRSAEDRARAQS